MKAMKLITNLVLLIKKHWLYLIFLALIFILALIIRWHNLLLYYTFWADDGGAQMMYVQQLVQHFRLPTIQESYLAWHEPLYYLAVAGWEKFGNLFGQGGLDWWEALNIIFYFVFLIIIWLLTKLLFFR